MLEIGWRTARLCANETYMDCPYYEQLQYFGDTRIQAMITLYNTHDAYMVKNAIEQGRQSVVADGITMSRYPSSLHQFISSFSLWWICMGHDYWMYRGDEAYMKTLLPAYRGVLSWYEQKAVIVLLALLSLGVKNIHLGPTLPAFLSPNVAALLVENFGIAGIDTVENDMELFFGK